MATGAARLLVSASFAATGTAHFTHTRAFERIIPPVLPRPRTLVRLSGAAELLGALGLAFGRRRLRTVAGYWLIATLIAVFPANVQMALHPDNHPQLGPRRRPLLWARLPLQPLLIALVAHVMQPDARHRG